MLTWETIGFDAVERTETQRARVHAKGRSGWLVRSIQRPGGPNWRGPQVAITFAPDPAGDWEAG